MPTHEVQWSQRASQAHLRRHLIACIARMLVAGGNGEFGQNPLAEGDEKRIATEIIDHCDEKEMLQYKLGPEVRLPCRVDQHPQSAPISRQPTILNAVERLPKRHVPQDIKRHHLIPFADIQPLR